MHEKPPSLYSDLLKEKTRGEFLGYGGRGGGLNKMIEFASQEMLCTLALPHRFSGNKLHLSPNLHPPPSPTNKKMIYSGSRKYVFSLKNAFLLADKNLGLAAIVQCLEKPLLTPSAHSLH